MNKDIYFAGYFQTPLEWHFAYPPAVNESACFPRVLPKVNGVSP